MKRHAVFAAAVPVVLFCAVAAAQAPLAPEFLVNTYTTGFQWTPAIASDGSGAFVVAWQGLSANGSSYDVLARRYTPAGVPIDAAEFVINTYTVGSQGAPAVAAHADGRLTFVWTSYGQDGDGHGVFGRQFDSAGLPVGGEFKVSEYTTGSQRNPSVAMDGLGGFVVAWNDESRDGDDNAVFARRFDRSGVPHGSEFQVNTYTTGDQRLRPGAVASDAEGNFVVVWSSYRGETRSGEIFARRFDAAGVPRASEFHVNAVTSRNQIGGSVIAKATGEFVVFWDSGMHPGGDTWDVVARRFDVAGIAEGLEFIVNQQILTTQVKANASFDAEGNFVVVWSSYHNHNTDVFGRVFDGDSALTDEFVLPSFAPGVQQQYPVVAAHGSEFVVAWHARDEPASLGIFSRRFRVHTDVLFADDFETGTLDAWSVRATDGDDLSANAAAALDSSATGLQGVVDDVVGLYVQDDSPDDAPRYRARFWLDPNGFDPGEANGHLRTRVFIAFTEAPIRRVATVVLRRQNGAYSIQARAREDDNEQSDTTFHPINDGPHAIEIDLTPASGPGLYDGRLVLWVDGELVSQVNGVPNSRSAVDFVRLGALGVKSSAAGTLFLDEFESRRTTYIGP
jgi:hypothetical protein